MAYKVTELWAVLAPDGTVMYSRGGSSTKAKLLVYPTEGACERALSNSWTRQVIPDRSKVRVERIYQASTITITQPGDDVDRPACSHCGHVFTQEDETINTCAHEEYVTLCRPCYDKAGSSVR